MDMMFCAFVVVLFAAAIFLFEAGWLWWSARHGGGAQRITRRLRMMAARGDGVGGIDGHGFGAAGADRINILKQRSYSGWPALERQLRRVRQLAALDRLLLQAGVRWSVAQFLAGTLALLLAGLLAPRLAGWPPQAALLALAGAPALPAVMLLRARAARLRKLEQQLPEAADFLGRALRAGHSFANVLQMVGEELPDPIAGEFKAAYEEINYGVPMNEALHNLALRVPLTDLRYLVIAVLIQRESGGNLAEILGGISRLIRVRLKLIAQVRVLSAEGRLSAWILCLLPLLVALVMSLTSPQYISVLWTDPTGVRLLWWAVGIGLVGVCWMRNTIRIRT